MSVLKGISLKTLLIDLKDWFALKAQTVFSVNGTEPVDGDVTIKQVDLANNLLSDKTQQSDGEFILRTSGGNASIEDGDAFVLRMLGNRVHNGYVPEVLDMTVIPIPRVVPAPITATLDESVFEAYVSEAGTYVLTYDGEWSENPTLYGVTVSGTPFDDDSITIVWDGETTPEMTVYAPRTAPAEITATIDRDTFVAYVDESTTITLTYTTVWSEDPEDYGITVSGDPVGGDQIVVEYVKEDRGTIVTATPSALKSTGWNLYNHSLGYAIVSKYSEQYGFRIGGTYSAVSFSTTPSGTQETITPVDGMFSVPSDGFVHVLGGNATDTYIINAWSDWTEGYVGEFMPYEESTVDISNAMTAYFPYGLLRVSDVRDEINLNTLTAISRIGRMAYTAENLESAMASGRPYEADTNYIYIVKEIEDTNTITVDGSYSVNDHGNEFFYGTNVAVYLEILYGNNLKNKLERDVLTISAQTLSASQQAQVLTNIGGASQAGLNSANAAIANYTQFDGTLKSVGNIDLNTLKTSGRFYAGSGCTNLPVASQGGGIDVYAINANYIRQVFYIYNNQRIFTRACNNGTWTSWQELMPKSADATTLLSATSLTNVTFTTVTLNQSINDFSTVVFDFEIRGVHCPISLKSRWVTKLAANSIIRQAEYINTTYNGFISITLVNSTKFSIWPEVNTDMSVTVYGVN